MHGIPRFAAGRKKVSAGPERCEFILPQVVRLSGTELVDLIHAAAVVVVIQRDRRSTNRVSSFIQNLASDDSIGGETEHQMFGVDASAGHNRSGKFNVLIVAGRDKSAFGAGQRILSCRQAGKFILAVFGSDHKLKLLRILRVPNSYSRAGERTTVSSTHNGSGDSEARANRNGVRHHLYHLFLPTRCRKRSAAEGSLSAREQTGQPVPWFRKASSFRNRGREGRVAGWRKRLRDKLPAPPFDSRSCHLEMARHPETGPGCPVRECSIYGHAGLKREKWQRHRANCQQVPRYRRAWLCRLAYLRRALRPKARAADPSRPWSPTPHSHVRHGVAANIFPAPDFRGLTSHRSDRWGDGSRRRLFDQTHLRDRPSR